MLVVGALGATPVMDDVAIRRYTDPAVLQIERNPAGYPCTVGLPGDLHGLLGQTVTFYPERGGRYGPWLVADFEAPPDEGYMRRHGLAGDISCKGFNHVQGTLVIERISRDE